MDIIRSNPTPFPDANQRKITFADQNPSIIVIGILINTTQYHEIFKRNVSGTTVKPNPLIHGIAHFQGTNR